jgi:hypothetical protein
LRFPRSIFRMTFVFCTRRIKGILERVQIRGQAPKVRWRRNKDGRRRTIEEEVEIARKYGVEIPDDVIFVEADPGELVGSMRWLRSGKSFESAKGPRVTEHTDQRIHWRDHYNRDGKIPFLINPDILTSDEAIVAVFQHEICELLMLRRVFIHSPDQSMSATDYGIQVSTGRTGNYHDQAWDEADKIVSRMRRSGR